MQFLPPIHLSIKKLKVQSDKSSPLSAPPEAPLLGLFYCWDL
jgi:hypothetical protein